MKIAVIGWGSLIWCNKALKLASKWHKDGALLPIEFSRISKDSRLTLVLDKNAQPQRTLWAYSGYIDLEPARVNLALREGLKENTKRIGIWQKNNHEPFDQIASKVSEWASERDVDAAIWTDLKPKPINGLTDDETIEYLKNLCENDGTQQRAMEYIQLTPRQINTRRREHIREELGWNDIPLPDELFDVGAMHSAET